MHEDREEGVERERERRGGGRDREGIKGRNRYRERESVFFICLVGFAIV